MAAIGRPRLCIASRRGKNCAYSMEWSTVTVRMVTRTHHVRDVLHGCLFYRPRTHNCHTSHNCHNSSLSSHEWRRIDLDLHTRLKILFCSVLMSICPHFTVHTSPDFGEIMFASLLRCRPMLPPTTKLRRLCKMAQLSQGYRVILRVIDYFAKSSKWNDTLDLSRLLY